MAKLRIDGAEYMYKATDMARYQDMYPFKCPDQTPYPFEYEEMHYA